MSLDQTHAVGGFVTPGDQVNVILNFPVTDATGDTTRPQGDRVPAAGPEGARRRLLDRPAARRPAASLEHPPRAATTTTTTPQTQPSSLITLQVTPRQAEQIVQGTTLGTVWLSLNPPDFTPGKFKSPTEIVDQINLFNQPLTEAQRRAPSSFRTRRRLRKFRKPVEERGEHRERAVMETTSPSDRPGPQRYRVLAVEPDERPRTRMTLELAGIVPAPL